MKKADRKGRKKNGPANSQQRYLSALNAQKIKSGSVVLSKEQGMRHYITNSAVLNVCRELERYIPPLPEEPIRLKQDSLFNFKIKPYVHTDIDEGNTLIKKKFKMKLLESAIQDKIKKETIGSQIIPPKWYNRITLYLPQADDTADWVCTMPARFHDYLKEAELEELTILQEAERIKEITEAVDTERLDRKALITGQHRIFMRLAAQHLGVALAKIEEGIIDDMKCIDLLNSVTCEGGAFYIIFTWKVKRFKVYNLKGNLLRVFDEKRVHVTDGSDGLLDYYLLIFRTKNDFAAETKTAYEQYCHQGGPIDNNGSHLAHMLAYYVNFAMAPTVHSSIKATDIHQPNIAARNWKHVFLTSVNSFARYFMSTHKHLNDRVRFEYSREFYDNHVSTPERRKSTVLDSDKFNIVVDTFLIWKNQLWATLCRLDKPRVEQGGGVHIDELEYWKGVMIITQSMVDFYRSQVCNDYLTCLKTGQSLQYTNEFNEDWEKNWSKVKNLLAISKENVYYLNAGEELWMKYKIIKPIEAEHIVAGDFFYFSMLQSFCDSYQNERGKNIYFMKASNALLNCFKHFLTDGDTVSVWKQDIEELRRKAKDCMTVSKAYRNIYENAMGFVREGNDSLKEYKVNESLIFGRMKAFNHRIKRIIQFLELLKEYSVLKVCKIEGLMPFAKEYGAIFKTIINQSDYDPLDVWDNTVDRDLKVAKHKILEVDSRLREFMCECFTKEASIEGLIIILKRFENMKLKCLFIGVAYSTAFDLFGFELNELRDTYNRRRVEPVLEPYIPPISGMILWLRVFITSIVPIMDLFQRRMKKHNINIYELPDARNIINTYNGFLKALLYYEMLMLDSFYRHFIWVEDWLNRSIVGRYKPENASYEKMFINFSNYLKTTLADNSYLLRLGYIDHPLAIRYNKEQENVLMMNQLMVFLFNTLTQLKKKVPPIFEPVVNPLLTKAAKNMNVFYWTTWTEQRAFKHYQEVNEALKRFETIITEVIDIKRNQIDNIFQIMGEANYFYLHACPLSNIEFIQRNLLHQERALEKLTKHSFAVDKMTRKILNNLIDEMSSDGDDRRAKRQWLRLKSIKMGFSQDYAEDPYENFPFPESDNDFRPNEGERLDLRPGGIVLNQNDTLFKECMRFYNHFNKERIDTILTCTRKALRQLLEAIVGRLGEPPKFAIYEVEMYLRKPDIVTYPPISEMQNGLNKIAAGILRMPRDIYPWGIPMPCDKIVETKKEVRLFEHFWGVPMNMLEGTGIGLGMPPPPPAPEACDDGEALRCQQDKRRKMLKEQLRLEVERQREEELQRLEEIRLHKLHLKKQRRKEEEYQMYIRHKKIKYLARIQAKETKRRNLLRDIMAKRGVTLEEKGMDDFIVEAEDKYIGKLDAKLKAREEILEKRRLEHQREDDEAAGASGAYFSGIFGEEKTKIEEESIEDIMKLLHGPEVVEEEEGEEEEGDIPVELLSEASTNLSSICTIPTPEDVSDEQSIEEDAGDDGGEPSFVSPSDNDLKRVKDILGEVSEAVGTEIDSFMKSTSSEEEEDPMARQPIEGDEEPAEESVEDFEESSDEEENVELLFKTINVDDEALELPDFRKVTEDKYVDGTLVRTLFQVVCSHPDVQSLVADIQGAFSKVEATMTETLHPYLKYRFLWSEDKEEQIKTILSKNPDVVNLLEMFDQYQNLKEEILNFPRVVEIPPLVVDMRKFIVALYYECMEWKKILGLQVKNIYLLQLDDIYKFIDNSMKTLKHPISDIDDARSALDCLDEIKKRHVDFDHQIEKVSEVFEALIANKIEMTREERHKAFDIRGIFNLLTVEASNIQAVLCELQDSLFEHLITDIAEFTIMLGDFDDDFEVNGPQVIGLTSIVASERVLIYQDRMDDLLSAYERCCAGEILFGLPVTDYVRLNERRKELNLLQKLYGLFRTVMNTINGYFDIPWSKVDTDVMAADLSDYQSRIRRLPNSLKMYPAFNELKKKCDDFSEMCPILELMANKSMKDRHWKQLEQLLGCEFDVESPTFTLRSVVETPILKHLDDVEDICVSSVKEKDIEAKLKQVIGDWQPVMLTFGNYKNKGELLLKGADTSEIIGSVEDSLMILGSLNTNRYNAFYKKDITDWITKLSTTEFILSKWLAVQNLWMYLEGVFLDGDISKQMPVESKKFASINTNWIKMMNRATKVRNCLKVCLADENMKTLLPKLLDELESCQKSLLTYLEQKRALFPRFFFVSDPVLLEILGQASDPRNIQEHLLNVFENIAKLEFHQGGKEKILAIISKEGEKIKLLQPVYTKGGVELWLGSLLNMAKLSLCEIIRKCWRFITTSGFRIINMTKRFPSQIGLLGLQMLWTGEAENALKESRKNPLIMRKINDYFLKVLNVLIDMTTKDLTRYERVRYETLVTIHVHQRDIFDEICRLGITDDEDFEWLKQERFYYGHEQRECVVCITDIIFIYQNEFMGCSDRLVITPLTDRCYITLAQAIGMAMGGAPAGPAGTGKTETTKDMGKSLGKFVVVFNCSDQMDVKCMARIFKGLAQSGSWGCFDEFNRIELPVLSVSAQQISIVLIARRDLEKSFIFTDGDKVDLNMEFGIFLTMNPGYAGRQELPENLKVMFRTVAMMVPDRQIIMRVKLASCGFRDNIPLSRKFFVLYKLCEEQLSKQVHYDFGLRNILSVLRTLGAQKRANPTDSEETTLMRVLRDMNVSKLVDEDEPLFVSLIDDLFPGLKIKAFISEAFKALQNAIKQVCDEKILTNHPNWNLKVVQLYETSLVRHGLMTMGPTGSGKTSCIHVLMEAMTMCGRPHSEMRMNPKAITAPQMFGRLDTATNDWTDGIFSTLWRRTLKTPANSTVWIVLDGPVDAVWIENLNSVLDDNKTLTLANGDRIVMAPNSKLVFEPDNVDNASPATVSRMGMVFLSSSVLSWQPIVDAWLRKRPPNESELLSNLFYAIYDDAHMFLQSKCKAKMTILEALYIRQFTDILEGLLIQMKKKDPNKNINWDDEEDVKKSFVAVTYSSMQIEHFFLFGLMWTLGAVLELDERKKLETFLLEHPSKLSWPSDMEEGDTIFEYFVDDDGHWSHWINRVQEYQYPRDHEPEYATILVPNVDNTRTTFLIDLISTQKKAVLLIGEQGTAKTVMLKSYMSKYNPEAQVSKSLNFSFATTPNMFQTIIESYVEKRVGLLKFGPPNMKRMTVFIDDINMPVINEWGDQVTNEIVRQLMEVGGFYSLEKPGDFLTIVDMQFVGAMIHPGGGRNDIPPRLKRRFCIFNCTLPSNKSMDKIFGVFGEGYFSDNRFKYEIVNFIPLLVPLTRIVWQRAKIKMLPTPAKFHYIFNLRDLSRIWEGMLHIKGPECTNVAMVLKLWKHECTRVIADRFTEEKDKEWFYESLVKTFYEMAPVQFHKQFDPVDTYFVDFLRDPPEPTGDEPDDFVIEAPKIYEEIPSWEFLQEKLLFYMSQYNEMVRGAPMDMVFFRDAMIHLSKISRIIRTDRGSAMLVGVGGSGKQSLTKLSSFIANYGTHQITLTRTYNVGNFMEDLKYLYRVAGEQCQGISFIFTDNDIKDEAFLEFLNNVLSAGEVANLFAKDEQEEILNNLVPKMRKKEPKTIVTMDNLYSFFIRQARNNLHLVLCFSPVSDKFRSRALKFPGLISGCTFDWFFKWPTDALVAVAQHFLGPFNIVCTPEVKTALINLMGDVHDNIAESCGEYYERFRRRTYVTPKSFLSFLEGYKAIYEAKHKEIQVMAVQMSTGLVKLKEAAAGVELLRLELEAKNIEIDAASRAADKVLEEVYKRTEATLVVKAEAEQVAGQAQELVKQITDDKKIAEAKLAEAQPALEAAEAALQTIQPADIATVRKLGRPPYLITIIMDAVLVLFGRKVMKVTKDPDHEFFVPNWAESLRVMAESKFLANLQHYPRDKITAEIVDLLTPYFSLPNYTYNAAKVACGNVAGLLMWTLAMSNFYAINKDVLPLKANLARQENKLRKAQARYDDVMALLKAKQLELDATNAELARAMAEKSAVEEEAKKCKDKMDAAAALVSGLAGEQVRWKAQLKGFENETIRLIGDVLVLTGFLSYSGPFNADFRTDMRKKWFGNLQSMGIPFTKDLDIVSNLVDAATTGEWNLQGLPSDELSIQNGIIVTKAARYPLLIDPQNQGVNWIKNREKDFDLQVTVLSHKYFRQHIEDSLSLGRPLLIEDVLEELDPVLDNVLEKNFIKVGRSLKVKLADKEVDVSTDFRLYITTKLANPSYTPEIYARTSIIDFTVTMQGLEEQLLGRVILFEREELETERKTLLADVTSMKRLMKQLEQDLLNKLNSVQGSLVDDPEVMVVLNNTKNTSKKVTKKLDFAVEAEKKIVATRDLYRDVATRGSILYFLIVEMSFVNCMYQTSLVQFLERFELSMLRTEKASVPQKRVNTIIEYLTFDVFKFKCRGLYEEHKRMFTLLLCLKIDVHRGEVLHSDFLSFIKGGAALDLKGFPAKPAGKWLTDTAWLNLAELSKQTIYANILSEVRNNENVFKVWYENAEPEQEPLPLRYEAKSPPFLKLMFVRSLCPDRMWPQAEKYISYSIGAKFVEPVVLKIQLLISESRNNTPMICFLSMGSDPTSLIEQTARKARIPYSALSMGQGQEVPARVMLTEKRTYGGWLLLQNCHLGIDYMNELFVELTGKGELHNDFRLWLTSETNPKFPINLLQMCIKFTNEPPQGVRAGLLRTYGSVGPDMLEFSNYYQYRPLIYAISFLHSVVQERRKFGPLGWNIPYEFNSADWYASCLFVQNHVNYVDVDKGVDWTTLRYMIAEVQYGGRVTDDYDKRLLVTLTENWFNEDLFTREFEFFRGYPIYSFIEAEPYLAKISELSPSDPPQVFGLHPNANITCRTNETNTILDSILSIQPKESSQSAGETREDVVMRLSKDMSAKLPKDYDPFFVKERLKIMDHLKPLHIFLRQEIDRMQKVISIVRVTLRDLVLAIEGTIIMNESLRNALDSIFDAKVPAFWIKISWDSSSIGFWFSEFLERNAQFSNWIENGRPPQYWMSGFFNPQGFLTAMRQEVSRAHTGWALDSVTLHNTVTKYKREDVRMGPAEGVYVYGLFLEGASWDLKNELLQESFVKVLFSPLPVVHVYAINSTAPKSPDLYTCPVYKKIRRTDLNFITPLWLPCKYSAMHWILRGAALLCDTK